MHGQAQWEALHVHEALSMCDKQAQHDAPSAAVYRGVAVWIARAVQRRAVATKQPMICYVKSMAYTHTYKFYTAGHR